jgi:hypothetical protein
MDIFLARPARVVCGWEEVWEKVSPSLPVSFLAQIGLGERWEVEEDW